MNTSPGVNRDFDAGTYSTTATTAIHNLHLPFNDSKVK